MGVRSTAPRPGASEPARCRPKTPCLLRGRPIRFPDQVWSTDMTYVPLGRGHVCLSAIMDWRSRHMVGWGPHGTLGAGGCAACMEGAFERNGTPSICNGDRGPAYTARIYMDRLARNDVRQSMDGVRRWAGNVLMERWFRDLKHECTYQTEHKSMRGPRRIISEYVERHNFRRPHSSLDYHTPAEWYFSGINESNAPIDKMVKWAA